MYRGDGIGAQCMGEWAWCSFYRMWLFSALHLFTSSAKTVHLRRSTRVWDSFPSASVWDSRENPLNLLLKADLIVWVGVGISCFPEHPDRRSREHSWGQVNRSHVGIVMISQLSWR